VHSLPGNVRFLDLLFGDHASSLSQKAPLYLLAWSKVKKESKGCRDAFGKRFTVCSAGWDLTRHQRLWSLCCINLIIPAVSEVRSMWSDILRLDSYEMPGSKNKPALLCVNPTSEGKPRLAHSCISRESWGLSQAKFVWKQEGEELHQEPESPSASHSELCRAAEIDPGSRFSRWDKVNQTNCWTDHFLWVCVHVCREGRVCLCVCLRRTWTGGDGKLFYTHMVTHTHTHTHTHKHI